MGFYRSWLEILLKALPHQPGAGWHPAPHSQRGRWRRRLATPRTAPDGRRIYYEYKDVRSGWIPPSQEHPRTTTEEFYRGAPGEEPKDPWKWAPRRRRLHRQMVAEAFSGARLPMPPGERQAFLMMGGPGAGKSGIRENLATAGYVVVDPDALRERLPEYQTMRAARDRSAARKTHEEASFVADRVRDEAIRRGHDVIIDGTGKNLRKYQDYVRQLKRQGYKVTVLFADLPYAEGRRRIDARARERGRDVSEPFASETYSALPRNFDVLAAMPEVDRAVHYNTGVPRGTPFPVQRFFKKGVQVDPPR